MFFLLKDLDNMPKFDLVDKSFYLSDPFHAPYETIESENANKAKSEYVKLHPESKYIDILCRKSKIGSFNVV